MPTARHGPASHGPASHGPASRGPNRHGPGGAPAMWGRAERQAAAGAGSLFARLGDPDERRAAGIAALERAIARLRGGEWSESLADLIARAGTLDAGADGVGLESAGAGGRESDAAAAIAAGKDSA